MSKLVVRKGGTDLQKLASSIRKKRESRATAAAKIDRVILFDGSGSMGATDAVDLNGMPCSRWGALEYAWQVLASSDLAKGRLGAYVFSSGLVPVRGSASGKIVDLPYVGQGTEMCRALKTAAAHRNARLRVLLVSDGEATDGSPAEVVGAAVAIGSPVDTVYVGPKNGPGRDTLRRVAEATGGEFRDMGGSFDASRFLANCQSFLRLKS